MTVKRILIVLISAIVICGIALFALWPKPSIEFKDESVLGHTVTSVVLEDWTLTSARAERTLLSHSLMGNLYRRIGRLCRPYRLHTDSICSLNRSSTTPYMWHRFSRNSLITSMLISLQ